MPSSTQDKRADRADLDPGYGVVFCRTKMDTQKLAERMIKGGYQADTINDLNQAARDRVMMRASSRVQVRSRRTWPPVASTSTT